MFRVTCMSVALLLVAALSTTSVEVSAVTSAMDARQKSAAMYEILRQQVKDATKRKDLATAAAIERQLRVAKKDAERLYRDQNKASQAEKRAGNWALAVKLMMDLKTDARMVLLGDKEEQGIRIAICKLYHEAAPFDLDTVSGNEYSRGLKQEVEEVERMWPKEEELKKDMRALLTEVEANIEKRYAKSKEL